MDFYRAFLAIFLSFLILLGWQYFLVPPAPEQIPPSTQTGENKEGTGNQTAPLAAAVQQTPSVVPSLPIDPEAKNITVETSLYKAVIKGQGGGFQSFILKNYRSELDQNSEPMQLITEENPARLPMLFSLDNAASQHLFTFQSDQTNLVLNEQQSKATLVMRAVFSEGINILRTLTFRDDSYLIEVTYQIENTTDSPVQISPALLLFNTPFAHASQTSQFLFSGPAAFINGSLVETETKKLKDGPVILQGTVSWAGFVDNYFMTAVVPLQGGLHTITLQGSSQEVRTVISEGIRTLSAHEEQSFTYIMYFGPKKLQILQAAGHDLAYAVDFGWFDILAKPMLWLLNFFYKYSGNYGVAIILLTVLIKLIFWPITQKGMKSMKNMQKLQPKIAKLREKFKGDPAKMNQEMMALYKTYKVNPFGGCMPMLLQLPFFFALYKVLIATIELRHAPFMLWINDLSAPDRLWIGFDIPYLHGLPVLTLLMGASMYLQQKLTPTMIADPTQARIMQFLPLIFTFIFINFASGLVLYWLVNNLLSILQQQLINRQSKA